MWWQDSNYNRLAIVKTHGDELRAEAQASRVAKTHDQPAEVRIAVSGRYFHFGSLVIVFGRALREDDGRRTQGVRA